MTPTHSTAGGRTDGISIEMDSSGRIVLIEPHRRKELDQRVFRQTGDGYEWAHLSDYRENGQFARFYGWASKELPSSMTSGESHV